MTISSAAGRGGRKRARDGDQSLPSKARKTEVGVDGGWRRSKCTEKDLLWLIAKGLLQENITVEWHPACKDESAFEQRNRVVYSLF